MATCQGCGRTFTGVTEFCPKCGIHVGSECPQSQDDIKHRRYKHNCQRCAHFFNEPTVFAYYLKKLESEARIAIAQV